MKMGDGLGGIQEPLTGITMFLRILIIGCHRLLRHFLIHLNQNCYHLYPLFLQENHKSSLYPQNPKKCSDIPLFDALPRASAIIFLQFDRVIEMTKIPTLLFESLISYQNLLTRRQMIRQ